MMKWWTSVERVGVAVWCPSLSIGQGSNPTVPSSCALVEFKGYDRITTYIYGSTCWGSRSSSRCASGRGASESL